MQKALIGNQVRFGIPTNTFEEIPVGTYAVMFDSQREEFYLEVKPPFKLPEKIYGDEEQVAERYLNTYNNKPGNLGIALIGKKGTGKSLLGKLTAVKSDLPIILITGQYAGPDFLDFMSSIQQDIVVFLDEFEKVYYEEDIRNQFLSLLDGVYTTHHLYILTSNTKEIGEFLINRPGRIWYLREYDILERSVIDDVIDDNLKNLDNKGELGDLIQISGMATMDVILSTIFEMNLYNETPKESLKFLNVSLENQMFDFTFYPTILEGEIKSPVSTMYNGKHPLTTNSGKCEVYVNSIKSWYNVDWEISNINDFEIVDGILYLLKCYMSIDCDDYYQEMAGDGRGEWKDKLNGLMSPTLKALQPDGVDYQITIPGKVKLIPSTFHKYAF